MKINPSTQFVSVQYFDYGFAVLAVLTIQNYADLSTDDLCDIDIAMTSEHPAKKEIHRILDSRIPKEEPEKKGAEFIGKMVLFSGYNDKGGKYYSEYFVHDVRDNGQAFKVSSKPEANYTQWISLENYALVDVVG
jgi:hypothetical protein